MKLWLYITGSLLVGLAVGYFIRGCTIPETIVNKPDSTYTVPGKIDSTVTERYVEKSITVKPKTEGHKKKAVIKDSLITIDIEYDTETDSITASYIAKLNTLILKQVDTVFVRFSMDTVKVPEKPYWNFEKGVYTGIAITVAIIGSIAYAIYKVI